MRYLEQTACCLLGVLLAITGVGMAQDVPAGARVFLCGDDTSAWAGDLGEWVNAGGATLEAEGVKKLVPMPGLGTMVNGPTGRTKHLFSKAAFGDVYAHIEFVVPQGSNSGVYFQGRYEVQVLDSWGATELEHGDCGGIYQRWNEASEVKGYEGHPPRVNASRPPGVWQSFDVWFRAPRFDAEGKKTENARFLKVVHNGVVVHENVELTGPTRSNAWEDEKPLGPMMFQGDHGPVAYRNIQIVPMDKTGRPAFFAMDTGTKDDAHTTPAQQATMLAELGYAGICWTGTQNLPEVLSELDQRGLGLFGIYTGLNIDGTVDAWESGLAEAMKQLKGRDTTLWMPVTSKLVDISSPEGDEAAVAQLQNLADLAAENGLRIVLYPHTASWVETTEDAVRVAEKVDRPNVGVTFNLCHWLKVDGKDLKATLTAAMPYLMMVSINGAENGGENWDSLIQNLGSGSYDVAALMAQLKEMGYTGPVGLQGYGIGGDVHANLTQSMEAWNTLAK